ncbi:hypothetical protein BDC45DRAFT_572534 [Circinella umbellata]|nr:hypothetical protein BDC45DRAFT_572534 [Circinella umbellata]
MTSDSSVPFIARRSTVYGADGMVACSEPLVTQVGINIQTNGGNTADADVAVAGITEAQIPIDSIHGVTVPGAVVAWVETLSISVLVS